MHYLYIYIYILNKFPIRTFVIHSMNLDSSEYIPAFIYWTKQKRSLILHLFKGSLGFIPFPKAINSYFDVLLDSVFKVE